MQPHELSFSHGEDGVLVLRLAGAWYLSDGLSAVSVVEREMSARPGLSRIGFDTARLGDWDTGLLTFVTRVSALCRARGISAHTDGLPGGLRRLLALAQAVPEKKDTRSEKIELPFLNRVGGLTLTVGGSVGEVLGFLGESVLALGRFLVGKARYRRADFLLLVQQAGVEALPIVTLVSFLLGVILAFVGAVQLEQFGATVYVADLVGVAMVRDMGALITAIAMAGRSGAAYAAQLGSMKVTQEIDALSTSSISPVEFLVLPRMLALVLMMPLLTLCAQFVGILGGAAVGIGLLDLSAATYMQQTTGAVGLSDLIGGIFKGGVYGVLIALAGCLRGMQAGKSSAGVGDAATSAVVTGIVAIIAACGGFQVLFYVLGW